MSVQLQRLTLKAKLFRGLGDSTRLSILELLHDGEKSASEIVRDTDHSQSNVSNHLSCLLDCGLVKNRQSDLARGIYECVNYNEEPKKR